jgi:hypothetical protein
MNAPVDDEEALAVHHVGDHEDLVDGGVGELQRRLGTLDVEGQGARLGLCFGLLGKKEQRSID